MRYVKMIWVSLVLISFSMAEVKPNIQMGSRAVLFNFDGLAFMSADAFEGGIGGKYFISPNMAVRAGLQFITAKKNDPVDPPAGMEGQDGETSGTTFGLSAAIEMHTNTSSRVSPYFGGGIRFAATSTEDKEAHIGPASDQTIIKNRASGESIEGFDFQAGTEISFFGLFGVEFFIFNEVSLAAEYRLGYMHVSYKDEEITTGNTTVTNKQGSGSGFGVTSQGILTLSIYF